MKRLLLASIDFSKLSTLTKKPLGKLRLAFIPTAADPYEEKWFLEEDREKLREMGIKFFELDIKNKTKKELLSKLRNVDVVFVAGGNSFYLLEKVRESQFDEVVNELVNRGVIYVGVSAGAVLAGPNIEPVSLLDDPKKAPNLKSYEGLGLVDFVVLPHYGDKKYEKKYQKIMEKFEKKRLKLIPLTNEQAIIMKGKSYRITG